MKEAIGDGVELWGYTPWGCIDLVSAGTGEIYLPRTQCLLAPALSASRGEEGKFSVSVAQG